MDSVLAHGIGPANLILRFLCSRLYEESARDLSAIFTSCKAWACIGDGALATMKFAYLQSFPASARQWMDASNQSPFGALIDGRSARIVFLEACRTLHSLTSNRRYGRDIEERDIEEEIPGFLCHSGFGPSGSAVILFEEPLEFFGALRALVAGRETPSPTRVIVGPSFETVDLSAPKLAGQFTLVPHDAESYPSDAPSLLAAHPSALTCGESIAMAVVRKLPSGAVFGVNATLGRLLAGTPTASGEPAPPWRARLVAWAAENITPNGPYFVCEGFPLPFTAPAAGGFYDADTVRNYEKNMRTMMVRYQIGLRRREAAKAMEAGHRDFVSFVGIYFSGVLGVRGTLFSLRG